MDRIGVYPPAGETSTSLGCGLRCFLQEAVEVKKSPTTNILDLLTERDAAENSRRILPIVQMLRHETATDALWTNP
jgi:hypothetical protein